MWTDRPLYTDIMDNLFDGVYFVNIDHQIEYWNKGAERITGFSKSDVLGRKCYEDFLVHTDEKGQNLCTVNCPLKVPTLDAWMTKKQVYLRHREGYRLPVFSRVKLLKNEDGETQGAIEIFTENTATVAMRERIIKLEAFAMLDPLTEVGNRRCAKVYLEHKLRELERYGWPFGMIFIDIDHFKEINDYHGHYIGDRTLKYIAKTLQNSVRSFDSVCRWGGEEFLVIVSNVERDDLFDLAEKLRVLVEKSYITVGGENVSVTVSAGATVAKPSDTIESLINRVDKLMYNSKKSGRNCITLD